MSDLLRKLQDKYNKPQWQLLQFARLVDAVDLVPVRDCGDGLEENLRVDLLEQRLDLLDERINQPSPCLCTQWSTCFMSWSRQVECGHIRKLEQEQYAKLKPGYDAIRKLSRIIGDNYVSGYQWEYAKGHITLEQLRFKLWMRPQLVAIAKATLAQVRADMKEIERVYFDKIYLYRYNSQQRRWALRL